MFPKTYPVAFPPPTLFTVILLLIKSSNSKTGKGSLCFFAEVTASFGLKQYPHQFVGTQSINDARCVSFSFLDEMAGLFNFKDDFKELVFKKFI